MSQAPAHPIGSEAVLEVARPRSNRRLAVLLMFGALVSKALGFLREVLMAHMLGASLIADSFRCAMTATLLPFALLQNESVTAVMIPMHRDWQPSGEAPSRLTALTFDLTLIAALLTIGIELLGSWWTDAIAGGFDEEGRRVTLDFVRIMALGMPGAVMVNSLAAGEIALGRSRLTTLRASILNLSILVGIALLATTSRLEALAWSFTFAFSLLAAWGGYTLWRGGDLDLRGARATTMRAVAGEFWRRLRPLLVVPIAEQGNIWIERVLASRFATGTVASLDYARNLTESAVLLISQPLGLVVMSEAPVADSRARIEAIARPILAVALPASVFLGIFASDIARLVYARGAFRDTAVLLTSEGLRGIAWGLWATMLGWILLRFLNSTGRNRHAALIWALAYGGNVVINLVSIHIYADTQGPLMLGIGEAARGYILLAGVLIALKGGYRVMPLIGQAMIPAAAMAVAGWWIEGAFTGMLARLFAGSTACLVSILVAGAMLIPAARIAAYQSIRLAVAREVR